MSIGVFGLFLTGLLVVMCGAKDTRGRTVFTAVVGLMLGVLIAGSDGVLVEPSRDLVNGVRLGLTAASRSVGDWLGEE